MFVKHQEVIEEILEFEGYFDLVHVRSHSGEIGNEGADELARDHVDSLDN